MMKIEIPKDAPALKIQGLNKHYDGVSAVQDLSFEIRPGEIFGLLGPNGAGKSTTINIVSGVARLETGKVEVFGYDNQKDFQITRRIVGVMHQEVVADPFFKIHRALEIHSGYYGVKDDPKWRKHLIDRLGLGPHLHKHMNKLSGGLKRRFMVAKAMIHRPRLLILDEPTAGVDVELRRAIWEFVRQMNTEGTTVLLTTHYLEEAEKMCGRIAIMNHGKLVALDTTKNLMALLDRKTVEVRLRERLQEIPTGFDKYSPIRKEEGQVLLFQLPKDTDAGEVLQALYKSGINISEIVTSAATLEDVFLELTGSTNNMEKDLKNG